MYTYVHDRYSKFDNHVLKNVLFNKTLSRCRAYSASDASDHINNISTIGSTHMTDYDWIDLSDTDSWHALADKIDDLFDP